MDNCQVIDSVDWSKFKKKYDKHIKLGYKIGEIYAIKSPNGYLWFSNILKKADE